MLVFDRSGSMSLPAGTSGGVTRFVLAKGVPPPTGNSGYACIVSEETGEPIGKDSAQACHLY